MDQEIIISKRFERFFYHHHAFQQQKPTLNFDIFQTQIKNL